MIMVAIWLPIMALFASFAIDLAHWWDYSRNLQNRADAAALAAGSAYGATCFNSPSQAAMDPIGETAQQYAGPPPGTPDANLPYQLSQLTTGGFQPYYNQPNLSKGTPDNFHLLLNSTQYFPSGQNWTMGNVCDATDENGVTAPMVDVRVSQANLGLFLPLVPIRPTISAHARVELEGAFGTGNVTPIAVRSSDVNCVEANFITESGTILNTSGPVTLTKEGQDSTTGSIIWDIPNGTKLTMPTTPGDNVYVQVVINDCGKSPSPTPYDSGSGVLYINNYSTTAPVSAPAIVSDGVTLASTGSCAPDQYFSTSETDCSVNVTAHVAFPSGATNEHVTAVDTYIDPNSNPVATTTQSVALSNGGSGTTWTSTSALTIVDATNSVFNLGRHQIAIRYTYTSLGGSPVSGSLGTQQQAFSACDSAIFPTLCTDSGVTSGNDSGPIKLAELSTCNTSTTPPTCTGGFGANAFAAASSHTVDLVVETGTIANAKAGQPPTVLRFSVPNSPTKATGLLNCGQGSGTKGDLGAIVSGCPIAGSSLCPAVSTNSNFDYCAPLAINLRNDVCLPAGSQLGDRTIGNPSVPVDCFETVGGNKSPIPQGLACRIITNATIDQNGNCTLPPSGSNLCSSNNWSNTNGAEFIGDTNKDPRAMVMVISKPENLSTANEIVPIENFGVFYVTGWNTQGSMSKYNCDSYTSAPDPSVEHQNDTVSIPAKQGSVWGYWIKDTIPNAIPSGTPCDPTRFGSCTAALIR